MGRAEGRERCKSPMLTMNAVIDCGKAMPCPIPLHRQEAEERVRNQLETRSADEDG